MNDKRKLAELMTVAFLAGCSVATISWWSRIKMIGNAKEMLSLSGTKMEILHQALYKLNNARDESDLEELQAWFEEQKAFVTIIEESM